MLMNCFAAHYFQRKRFNDLTRVHYALTELLKRLSRGHYVPYLVLMEVLEIVLYNESCV